MDRSRVIPLQDCEQGLEAEAGRILRSLGEASPVSSARHAVGFHRMVDLAGRERATGARRWAFASAGCALAVAALWLVRSARPGEAPNAVAIEESASSAVATRSPTGSSSEAGGAGLATAAAPIDAESATGEGWQRVGLGEVGVVELSREVDRGAFAEREMPNERQLRLERGMLRAHIEHQDPSHPVVVVTPHLRVAVIGTLFDVRVDDDASSVFVHRGRVRVESGARFVYLGAGDSVRSDHPRLIASPASPPPVAPAAHRRPRAGAGAGEAAPAAVSSSPDPGDTVAACGRLTRPGATTGCLRQLMKGDGLAAENALFALGLDARDRRHRPAEALTHFRDYERRFPNGVLGPEVALSLFDTLVATGLTEEALEAAASFESRFAEHPRAASVALARAQLLCADAERWQQGAEVLRQLAERKGLAPETADAAQRAQSRCRGPAPGVGPPGLPGSSPSD